MPLRIRNIKIRYDEPERKALRKALADMLPPGSPVPEFDIVRRSIDARQRVVHLIYTIDIKSDGAVFPSIPGASRVEENGSPPQLPLGSEPLAARPVVVGAGPAGLFAAWLLGRHGFAPLVLDRGGDVAQRSAALNSFFHTRCPDPECNALFGLGGAGTFSDGKLTTGVKHPWLRTVLEVLVECGAPSDVLIDAKPHVGTDKLRTVVTNLTQKIRETGGDVLLNTRLSDLVVRDGSIAALKTTQGELECFAGVLAVGHSARDTWTMLQKRGLFLSPKPFQLGVRIEHPQKWLDQVRYGEAAGHQALGAADYKLATRVDNTPVFSFCMCPGGETMPTVNEPGHLAINGMSFHSRGSDFSSSAVVVTCEPDMYSARTLDDCIAFQRAIEASCFEAGGKDYSAPAQRLPDFLAGRQSSHLPHTSYRFGTRTARLDRLLPAMVVTPLRGALSKFDKQIRGYIHPDALLLAPESRASSPVRVERDRAGLEAIGCRGLYPAGEGAGYAGGIMSSALDGLNAAAKIITRYKPNW